MWWLLRSQQYQFSCDMAGTPTGSMWSLTHTHQSFDILLLRSLKTIMFYVLSGHLLPSAVADGAQVKQGFNQPQVAAAIPQHSVSGSQRSSQRAPSAGQTLLGQQYQPTQRISQTYSPSKWLAFLLL